MEREEYEGFNPLFVLDDKTRLYKLDKRFLIVKKNFDFFDNLMDLGFKAQQDSFDEGEFYSIPILSYPNVTNDEKVYRDVYEKFQITGKKRFLTRVVHKDVPMLIEIYPSDKKTIMESVNYFHCDLNELRERDKKMAESINRVEKEFSYATDSK